MTIVERGMPHPRYLLLVDTARQAHVTVALVQRDRFFYRRTVSVRHHGAEAVLALVTLLLKHAVVSEADISGVAVTSGAAPHPTPAGAGEYRGGGQAVAVGFTPLESPDAYPVRNRTPKEFPLPKARISNGVYGGDEIDKVSIPYRKSGVKAPCFLTGFTHLRSAVVVANALAYALDVRAVGVCRQQAADPSVLAAMFLDQPKRSRRRVIVPAYSGPPRITWGRKRFLETRP